MSRHEGIIIREVRTNFSVPVLVIPITILKMEKPRNPMMDDEALLSFHKFI